MTKRGFLEETAVGVAEAVSADRAFAAAVLLGSVLFLRDARWDVGAMFLAGAAVSKSSAKTRWLVFLLIAGIARGVAADFPVRDWSDLDRMAPVYTTTPRYLRVALCLVSGGAGMGSRGFTLLGAALGIAAPLYRGEAVQMSWPLFWTAASLGLVIVGATCRPRAGLTLAMATLVVAAVWNTATSGWPAPSFERLLTRVAAVATEPVFVAWPVLAGLAAAELRRPLDRDDPVRLLVLIQRRPWLALSGVAAFALLYGGPTFPLGDLTTVWAASQLALALVGIGASLLVFLAAAGRTAFGLLAAPLWLSAAVTTAWATIRWVDSGSAGVVVAQTAFAAFLPLLVVSAARSAAPRWVTSRGLPILVALLLVQAFLRYDRNWEFASLGWGATWLWLLIAPVAFQAATQVDAPARRVVVIATALGVAWWLAVLAGGGRFSRFSCAAAVGTWFLGGVYVVIARQALRLTAVPLDHPSVAEVPLPAEESAARP